MKKQQEKRKYAYSMWSKPKSNKVMRQKQEQQMSFNASISGDNNNRVLLHDDLQQERNAKTCGKCEYSEHVQRGNKCFYYCNKHFSKRTHNGKLKPGSQACYLYRESQYNKVCMRCRHSGILKESKELICGAKLSLYEKRKTKNIDNYTQRVRDILRKNNGIMDKQ